MSQSVKALIWGQARDASISRQSLSTHGSTLKHRPQTAYKRLSLLRLHVGFPNIWDFYPTATIWLCSLASVNKGIYLKDFQSPRWSLSRQGTGSVTSASNLTLVGTRECRVKAMTLKTQGLQVKTARYTGILEVYLPHYCRIIVLPWTSA